VQQVVAQVEFAEPQRDGEGGLGGGEGGGAAEDDAEVGPAENIRGCDVRVGFGGGGEAYR
jgi:hypothetical protein